MEKPLVSVIIPVYNAADFVQQAVNSVLPFEEVGEILLIEDGAKDKGYEKCKELELKFSKVKVLIHPARANKGASASRNLGILHAKFPYIAFLDADDYFLPNRFQEFELALAKDKEFDGLYESVQYFNGSNKIYGISKKLPPNDLLFYLIRGTYGHFHTNGLIVKREILFKAGLFVESLDLHEDSDLWIKLAFSGKLISGKIGIPVAMVRRHEGNRIWSGTTNKTRLKQMLVTWSWLSKQKSNCLIKGIFLVKIFILKLKVLDEGYQN